jgi:hypothetical protein
MVLQAVPMPDSSSGRWTWEAARGSTRAVRVSPHAPSGLVTVSLWRDDRCVGSLRLSPVEVAALAGRLTGALAELATEPAAESATAARLAAMEARLIALEDAAG